MKVSTWIQHRDLFDAKYLIKLSTSLQAALRVARTSMGDKILQRPMLVNKDFQGQALRAVSSSSAWLALKPQEHREAQEEPWSRHISTPRQQVRWAASPSGGSPQILLPITSPSWAGESTPNHHLNVRFGQTSLLLVHFSRCLAQNSIFRLKEHSVKLVF